MWSESSGSSIFNQKFFSIHVYIFAFILIIFFSFFSVYIKYPIFLCPKNVLFIKINKYKERNSFISAYQKKIAYDGNTYRESSLKKKCFSAFNYSFYQFNYAIWQACCYIAVNGDVPYIYI